MKINDIVLSEISKFISENEEYFTTKLPKDVKKHSHKYVGRGVTWYGDPNQMIVVPAANVHGMFGNIYDPEKLQYVKDMILNSPENVEFECSYAMGTVINAQEIAEHQNAYLKDRFMIDYDGHNNPYSTGNDNLDRYLGTDDMSEMWFIENNVGNQDIIDFFVNHKFDLADNNISEETILSEFNELSPDDAEMDAFNEFVEIENNLKDAITNNHGDLNKFMVQLRDAHHRVMGAIDAGERYVCVNLDKNDIARYGNYITRV